MSNTAAQSINAHPTRTPLPAARSDVAVPEGYIETPLWDPFEAFMGPLFDKRLVDPANPDAEPELWMAFYVDERHLNAGGICHGGMLMTFADAVLGTCAWNALDRAPCVTLSMQTSFMAPARLGDLVECKPVLERKTRSVLFVRGSFYVNGKTIMTASSIWKVIGA